MIKKLKFAALVCLTCLTCQSQGVLFEKGSTWQDLLQKARKENKYIFVDCYASWCSPRKGMDKSVYPVDSVGTFMNENFISIKLQMDSSQADNDETRAWYTTAHYFGNAFRIQAYPSYLFFSPDGHVVHKDMGFKSCKRFLLMARAAMNPDRQFYRLLSAYRDGSIKGNLIPVLAESAQDAGDDSLSAAVARRYIGHYLLELPREQLWTVPNIRFIHLHQLLITTKDTIFQLYYRDRTVLDSILRGRHSSDIFITEVMFRSEVEPIVQGAFITKKEPHWHRLKKDLSQKYDTYHAAEIVLQGQVKYYKKMKAWNKYIHALLAERKLNSFKDSEQSLTKRSLDLNSTAFEVFKYSKNKHELMRSLSCVTNAIAMIDTLHLAYFEAEEMDTKANLLYKLGKKAEGIALEQKSHELVPGAKDIAENYKKMRDGLPTWVTE